jgi:hypothetical protein
MSDQMVDYGVCTGFVPNHKDFAIIRDISGMEIWAYIGSPKQIVTIGKSYKLSKSGSTYHLGDEIRTA